MMDSVDVQTSLLQHELHMWRLEYNCDGCTKITVVKVKGGIIIENGTRSGTVDIDEKRDRYRDGHVSTVDTNDRLEASPSAGSALHPVSFGKMLQSAKVKDIVNSNVKRIGRNCIALSFLNPTAANTFLCNPFVALKGLRTFIPLFNVTRLGLV
ncbi:hypothetical protein EVAR_59126_1 [Eumeta japonica]|uniref:Uncharacterized protein n=1 Tax=Eumeta variegata TaxID=151549 RepID=A0A4C1ZHD2_EUMVA|nr:hypothetical protein EVAR_59126_1 [Eumeta japonica]